MTTYEVLIDHIGFHHDLKRGEDGAVWYLILGEPNPDVVCSVHPQRTHYYERQAFRFGKHGHRLDATPQEIADDCANVWGWDGNRSHPTITPSFRAQDGRPYHLHSYVRNGQLILCPDSTVVRSTTSACMGVD